MIAHAERTLPHDLPAEKAVLGAVLIRPDVLPDVAAVLAPADFFRDAHRRIIAAVLKLAEDGSVVDGLTLRESLERSGELDSCGGPAYLFSLTDGVPHSSHALDYARIVREKAKLRAVISAANKTLAEAYGGEMTAADVLADAQSEMFRIADDRDSGDFQDMRALMGAAMNTVDRLAAEKRHVTGVPSGFDALDTMTRGFQPKDLIIVAARPSMGKTSLAMNVAENAAIQHGKKVAVFSVEMGADSLGLRLLSSQARVDHHKLLSGRIGELEYGRMAHAIGRLSDAGIYVNDASGITPYDVRAKARRLQAEHGLDLIVIDYLQLMKPAQRAENKNLEVGAITVALKAVAKDLNVPIVLLSQLSRDVERRGDHRPQLSDLRDSGSIEQDADVILFIYREEKYNPTADNAGIAEIIIGKQRNGPTGPIRVRFHDHLVRFDNLDTQHERFGAGAR